jgi:hypothetical protein
MRIAGGVLLIIVAVINLGAGITYLTGGAIAGGAGKLGASMTQLAEENARKTGKEMTAEEKAQIEQSRAAMDQFSAQAGPKAGMLLGLGAFLLITVGTSIAGAVQLFRRKGAMFIMVAAALVIVAEIIGAVAVRFGVMNVPGIVAAVLAFLGARSIGKPVAAAPVGSPAPM